MYKQLTVNGNSGQAGRRVPSVVVLVKGPDHDHVQIQRLRTGVKHAVAILQKERPAIRKRAQVDFIKYIRLVNALIVVKTFYITYMLKQYVHKLGFKTMKHKRR